MKQGQVVANRLADLKAGKNVTLSSIKLWGEEDKELKKEDRLRRYLELVTDRRQALDDPEGDYGICRRCGGELGFAELDQMPWAELCRGCMGEFV